MNRSEAAWINDAAVLVASFVIDASILILSCVFSQTSLPQLFSGISYSNTSVTDAKLSTVIIVVFASSAAVIRQQFVWFIALLSMWWWDCAHKVRIFAPFIRDTRQRRTHAIYWSFETMENDRRACISGTQLVLSRLMPKHYDNTAASNKIEEKKNTKFLRVACPRSAHNN